MCPAARADRGGHGSGTHGQHNSTGRHRRRDGGARQRHRLGTKRGSQARIQGVGAGAGAHPWGGVSPLKMHDSIAFMHQSIIGRPPLGEILHPPLAAGSRTHTLFPVWVQSKRPNIETRRGVTIEMLAGGSGEVRVRLLGEF